jgi:hypothetical protein
VPALLDQECALTRTGDGVYERDLGRVWWGWEAQHGGYVTALAMTAVAAELDDADQSLQHLTMHFMRPFAEGPFRAEVTVERRGRTMANATARLWSGGKLSGMVLTSFARRRAVSEVTAARMPATDPFDPDEEPHLPGFHVPTFDRVEMYPRFADVDGTRTARVGGWCRPRTPEIVDDRYLVLLADFWPPAAYSLWERGAAAQSVDLTYHARSRFPRPDLPPGEPLLVVLTTRASVGGFVDEDVEIWSRGGELLAQSRQMRFVHG